MRNAANGDESGGDGARKSRAPDSSKISEAATDPGSPKGAEGGADSKGDSDGHDAVMEFLWSDRERNEAPLPEIPWDRPGGLAAIELPFLTRGPRRVPLWCLMNPIWRWRRRRARARLFVGSVAIWVRFTGPLPFIVAEEPRDPELAPDGDDGKPIDWRELEDDLERALRDNLRFRGARIDMTVARSAWMLAHARSYRACVIWRERGSEEGAKTDARPLARSAIEWMEVACEIGGASAGGTYSREFASMVTRLAGRSDEDSPLGSAVEAVRRSLARFESRTGRGSEAHRWFLAACIAALDAPLFAVAKPRADGAAGGDAESPRMPCGRLDERTRVAQLDLLRELLALDRATPPTNGGFCIGWTACHLAALLRSAGEASAALALLEEAETELARIVEGNAGVPHGPLQSVRRALFKPLKRAGRHADYESLLRRMIALEEERHGNDPSHASDWVMKAPSIGALRSRLARHLESVGRLAEAEACWRAGCGDSYGMRGEESGLRRFATFLCRQGRSAEAIELVRESIRRERASAKPDLRREFERLVMALDIHRMLEESAFALPETERREFARRLIEVTRQRLALERDEFDRSFAYSGTFVAARSGEAALALRLFEEAFPEAAASRTGSEAGRSGSVAADAPGDALVDASTEASNGAETPPSPVSFARFNLAMILTLAIQQHGDRPWEAAGDGGIDGLRRRAIAVLRELEEGMARFEADPKERPWTRLREFHLAALLLDEGSASEAHEILLGAVARCEADSEAPVPLRWRIGRLLIDATEAVGRFADLGPLRERYPDAPPFVDANGGFELWEEAEEDIPPVWGEPFRDPDRRSANGGDDDEDGDDGGAMTEDSGAGRPKPS